MVDRVWRWCAGGYAPGAISERTCCAVDSADEGARLIPGDGSAPIESRRSSSNAARYPGRPKGRAHRAGRRKPRRSHRQDDHAGTDQCARPSRVPAGLTYTAANFTRETIVDDLNRALYFGVAVVQSQGIEKGDVTYQIRADQEAGRLGGARLRIAGRGIGAPNAGPGAAAYAGIAYEVTTEAQTRRAVQELAGERSTSSRSGSTIGTAARRAWRRSCIARRSTKGTSAVCKSTRTSSITRTPSIS